MITIKYLVIFEDINMAKERNKGENIIGAEDALKENNLGKWWLLVIINSCK